MANTTRNGEKNYKICGAKARSHGGICQNPAGAGTDHPGEGRCKFHGGNAPVKHGRYSKITRPRIKELMEEFQNDPNPLDLLPETVLLRALLTDFVERHDQNQEALYTWKASYGKAFQEAYRKWYAEAMELVDAATPPEDVPPPPEPLDFQGRPGHVLDVATVSKLIDQVGAMVDRIEKHKATQSITLATLDQMLQQIGVELVHALKEEVSDEALRTRILETFERRWAGVRISPDGSVVQRSANSLPN